MVPLTESLVSNLLQVCPRGGTDPEHLLHPVPLKPNSGCTPPPPPPNPLAHPKQLTGRGGARAKSNLRW